LDFLQFITRPGVAGWKWPLHALKLVGIPAFISGRISAIRQPCDVTLPPYLPPTDRAMTATATFGQRSLARSGFSFTAI
jgi:hypothetical protein